MPFYLRKSVSVGPFRFNLSKSGVGLSAGVQGFRLGTGPRGHYVHAGTGGLYYRQQLSGARAKNEQNTSRATPDGRDTPQRYNHASDLVMREVDSAPTDQLRSEDFKDLLAEIDRKRRSIRRAIEYPTAALFIGAMLFAAAYAAPLLFKFSIPFPLREVGVAAMAAAIPAYVLGRWMDGYKRATVIMYDLQPAFMESYRKLTDAFDGLSEVSTLYHLASGAKVETAEQKKRLAGADQVVDKHKAPLGYGLPKDIHSNIVPPFVGVGTQRLYFLPDVVLVEEGEKLGAVSYGELETRLGHSALVETGTPPTDAEFLGTRWLYANKKGGPDRRFADNRELPMYKFEDLHLTSVSGLNEVLSASRLGSLAALQQGINAIAKSAGSSVSARA